MSNLLEKSLPTKQTRRIAGISLPLLLNAPFLGDYLQKVGFPIAYLFQPEARLLLLLSVLSISLFLLVISLVRSFNTQTEKQKDFIKLKYGIYWDKDNNPLCPSCKLPVSYGDYAIGGTGYRCFSCKKTFPLTDSVGNRLNPEQVIRNL